MEINLKEIFKDVNINSETAVKAISDYCNKELEIAKMRHLEEMLAQKRRLEESKHSVMQGYLAMIVVPITIISVIFLIGYFTSIK